MGTSILNRPHVRPVAGTMPGGIGGRATSVDNTSGLTAHSHSLQLPLARDSDRTPAPFRFARSDNACAVVVDGSFRRKGALSRDASACQAGARSG
jgi:hypothetical protein